MKALLAALFTLIILTLPAVFAVFAADEVIITGTVSSLGMKLRADDGTEYMISATGVGKPLMEEYDRKVTVKGVIAEEEGRKIIHVTSYQLRK